MSQSPPSQLSPPPSPPIFSLPTELLLQILSFAHLDPTPDPRSRFNRQNALVRHCQQFSSASQVCRRWREPGQEMMWKRICLMSSISARLLVESPLRGVYPTESLVLAQDHSRGKDALSQELLYPVVSSVWGVKLLEISDYWKVGLEVLRAESLSSLISLKLTSCMLAHYTRDDLLRLPFSLQSLDLESVNSHNRLCTPFSDFYSPGLSKLYILYALVDLLQEERDHLLLLLRLAAPHLTELSVFTGLDADFLLPTFPLFSTLRVLHKIVVDAQVSDLLESIPSKLVALHLYLIGGFTRVDDAAVARVPATIIGFLRLPSLVDLLRITIHDIGEEWFMQEEQAKEMVLALEARGIKLDFSKRD